MTSSNNFTVDRGNFIEYGTMESDSMKIDPQTKSRLAVSHEDFSRLKDVISETIEKKDDETISKLEAAINIFTLREFTLKDFSVVQSTDDLLRTNDEVCVLICAQRGKHGEITRYLIRTAGLVLTLYREHTVSDKQFSFTYVKSDIDGVVSDVRSFPVSMATFYSLRVCAYMLRETKDARFVEEFNNLLPKPFGQTILGPLPQHIQCNFVAIEGSWADQEARALGASDANLITVICKDVRYPHVHTTFEFILGKTLMGKSPIVGPLVRDHVLSCSWKEANGQVHSMSDAAITLDIAMDKNMVFYSKKKETPDQQEEVGRKTTVVYFTHEKEWFNNAVTGLANGKEVTVPPHVLAFIEDNQLGILYKSKIDIRNDELALVTTYVSGDGYMEFVHTRKPT